MEIVLPIIFLVLGFLLRGLFIKPSGRLVIDEEADEFFVAITKKPEDLKRCKNISLKVYVTRGRRN